MGLNFGFIVLFLFSHKKTKSLVFHKGYLPSFFGNRIFYPNFATIGSFYKISKCAKTGCQRKQTCVFLARKWKTSYVYMFFQILRPKLDFKVKIKYFLKNFFPWRYNISGTIRPISMIIFANCCKYYSLFILKENRF